MMAPLTIERFKEYIKMNEKLLYGKPGLFVYPIVGRDKERLGSYLEEYGIEKIKQHEGKLKEYKTADKWLVAISYWRGDRQDQWEYHWEIYLGKGGKVLGANLEDFNDIKYWPVFYVHESVCLLELEEAFETGTFLSSDLIMDREKRTLADHDLKYWPAFAAYNRIEKEELSRLIDQALEESKNRNHLNGKG